MSRVRSEVVHCGQCGRCYRWSGDGHCHQAPPRRPRSKARSRSRSAGRRVRPTRRGFEGTREALAEQLSAHRPTPPRSAAGGRRRARGASGVYTRCRAARPGSRRRARRRARPRPLPSSRSHRFATDRSPAAAAPTTTRNEPPDGLRVGVGAALVVLSVTGLWHLAAGRPPTRRAPAIEHAGGVVGAARRRLVAALAGVVGASIVLCVLAGLGLLLVAGTRRSARSCPRSRRAVALVGHADPRPARPQPGATSSRRRRRARRLRRRRGRPRAARPHRGARSAATSARPSSTTSWPTTVLADDEIDLATKKRPTRRRRRRRRRDEDDEEDEYEDATRTRKTTKTRTKSTRTRSRRAKRMKRSRRRRRRGRPSPRARSRSTSARPPAHRLEAARRRRS